MRDAATASLECPTNRDLAARLQTSSTYVVRVIQTAEAAGLITVERGNRQRVVRAPDGSWRTAGEINNKHWRNRTEADRLAPKPPRRKRKRDTTAPAPRGRDGQAGAAALARAQQAQAHVVRASVPAPVLKASSAGTDLMADKRGCRWPMWGFGQRATHVYCGGARESVCGPYCAAHAVKARRLISGVSDVA